MRNVYLKFFVFFGIFIFMIMPKNAFAKVTRVQVFQYDNGFTNTFDSSYTSHSFQNPGVNGSNFRITFNDTLQVNHNYTLSLTLTLISEPVSWFRWQSNAMSGILVGSAYVVSSPSSGTTLVNRYDHQYCIGVSCFDFYRKQSNIVFNFKPTSVSNPWSVNIPFDNSLFTYYSIDSYTLTDSGTSTTDTQAIINNNNINTQNIIDSQNNTTNAINDMNNNLTDPTINSSHGADIINEFHFYNDNTLSSVITAPIDFINSLNDTCTPVNLTYRNKNIPIPCGTTIFWGRSDVSTFRIFWNVLFGGFIIYKLLYKLFKVVNDAIDPTKDDIGGVNV